MLRFQPHRAKAMRNGCGPANRANIVCRHGYRCFSPFARLPRSYRPKVLHRHGHRGAVHRSGRLLADVLSRPDLRACENHHWPRSERNRAPARAAVHVVAGAVHRADELGRDAPRESASQARLFRGCSGGRNDRGRWPRTAVEAARLGAVPPGANPWNFMAIPLGDITTFAIFFLCAVLWRNNRDKHKRLMILAAACLMPAALVRWPGVLPLGPLASYGF